VFTAMAIGLAAPFLILSIFPSLSAFLPRPGAWMESLKQVLAFPVFATVIWLLWVIGQQIGMNQLALMLFALLAVGLAVWIAGRWPQNRIAGLAALVVGLGATAYCCATVTPEAQSGSVAAVDKSSGLQWEPFTPEKLASYRASGRPVLIDFTAAWCLTCQVNDRILFHSNTVTNRLNQSKIALLRADWTSYDPQITAVLAQYGRSSIPLYVIYGTQKASPVTLPDGVLSPSTLLDTLSSLNL
jgi:thiol:disulfide interchange protein